MRIGICRNCKDKAPLVTLGKHIGFTGLCAVCVAIIRDWIAVENPIEGHLVTKGTGFLHVRESLDRRNLDPHHFVHCPDALATWSDNQEGDDR